MSPDQLEEYVERWNPVLDSAEEIGKNWVQRLVDGLEDRIPALEATVARIKALLNRIASLNSAVSASGANTENGGTSSSDDSHFANGGLVTHPTRAMLGEAGAELVVPLTKGFGNPPAGGNGFGIGNSVNNNFNIYTQKPLDPKEVRRQIERSSYLAGSRI